MSINKIDPVTTKQTPVKQNRLIWIVVIVVAICLVLWGISQIGSKSLPNSGDTVPLVYGNTDIFCGTTQQNYSDLIDAVVKKDDYGFNEMMTNGRAFTIPSGTKALVLEMDSGSAQVRILEGTHINEIAWVAIEAIEK